MLIGCANLLFLRPLGDNLARPQIDRALGLGKDVHAGGRFVCEERHLRPRHDSETLAASASCRASAAAAIPSAFAAPSLACSTVLSPSAAPGVRTMTSMRSLALTR